MIRWEYKTHRVKFPLIIDSILSQAAQNSGSHLLRGKLPGLLDQVRACIPAYLRMAILGESNHYEVTWKVIQLVALFSRLALAASEPKYTGENLRRKSRR